MCAMTSNLKKWRQSASVIIIARTVLSSTTTFDYNLLMVKRNNKSSVLPNAAVFPGGVIDKADTSRDWLKLYEKFGLKYELFDVLNPNEVNRPSIFTTNDPNEIPKTISLRITAIRETFEETGILICKNFKNISEKSSWADYITSEDIRKWQEKIHKNPYKFIELCSHFEILPDLWSLYEWSNWVTPLSIPAKFNTVFFTAIFQKKPPTVADNNEISQVLWETPQQYLGMSKGKKHFVTVPQFYEISRLHALPQIDHILKFSKERSCLGVERYWPHIITTDSGRVFILPGDDLYPRHIDETNEDGDYLKEVPDTNVQHRVQLLSSGEKSITIKNYSPKYKHVLPLSNKL